VRAGIPPGGAPEPFVRIGEESGFRNPHGFVLFGAGERAIIAAMRERSRRLSSLIQMNAAMPIFRSVVISILRRFVNRQQGASASPQLSGGKALRNPQLNALLAALAVVYVVSPVDAVPDFVPILGWLDDGLVLWFGLVQAWQAMRGRKEPVAATVNGTVVETTARRVT
jgi:hypothetical protein